jgi:hypothetical protein
VSELSESLLYQISYLVLVSHVTVISHHPYSQLLRFVGGLVQQIGANRTGHEQICPFSRKRQGSSFAKACCPISYQDSLAFKIGLHFRYSVSSRWG